MKKPKVGVASSLRKQSVPARGTEKVETQKGMKRVKAVKEVPGEGGVKLPPGRVHGREAKHYAEPMSRFGGKG